MVNKPLADLHCHLLPQVDDGAADWDTAEAMLRMAKEDGIRQLILTPHRRPQQFQAAPAVWQERFWEFQARFSKLGISFALGSENLFEEDLPTLLRSGQAITMGDSRYVLTEFPDRAPYSLLHHAVSHLRQNGYRPILAHIERYACLREDRRRVEELSRLGAFFQLNADSILGKNGLGVRFFCGKLLKERLVDFVASDAHDLRHRRPQLSACARLVEMKFGTSYARQLFWENPLAVVRDEKLF